MHRTGLQRVVAVGEEAKSAHKKTALGRLIPGGSLSLQLVGVAPKSNRTLCCAQDCVHNVVDFGSPLVDQSYP